MPRPKFDDTLSKAIDDLQENGFSNRERLERWTSKLSQALGQIHTDINSIERRLREYLLGIFDKAVRRGDILRAHPTVERFTLDRIAPRLRNELTNRIMASANLIQLNREEAIANTLKRFAGWASSVPKGGSDVGKKRQIKADISKPIQRLPFTDRRVLIDQGHKLNSSISAVLASDAGAIAAVWHSNWRQINYDYREDHKERDEKVYLIRDSWAHKNGLVKKGPAGYTDEITQPAEEPFCRCRYRYLYHLRQLPAEMLTVKGRQALEEARKAA